MGEGVINGSISTKELYQQFLQNITVSKPVKGV